ncbi:DinB family protein [Botryobacter ruber]|uniref:DinB family protein n=1 Tax=Botryobacter ruber TaxID=2171629 RepID=UPI000E0AD4B6|nr:DinB family protein [Botryobacter ruber]
MNLKLEARYLQLEKSRNKLLNELSKLDDTLLNTAPEPGKWSINQIVAHLVLTDEVTVNYIQRKMQQPEKLQTSTLTNTIKSLLLKFVLKSWIKFKAPAVVAAVPETASLPALSKQWDSIRFRLEDVLTELPEAALDKCPFKHPAAGPLTILQTLTFLQDHFHHHQQQIQQLKKRLLVKA